jgi:hypothetical protein
MALTVEKPINKEVLKRLQKKYEHHFKKKSNIKNPNLVGFPYKKSFE